MNEQLEEKKESRQHPWIGAISMIILVLAVVLCLYVVIQVMSRGYANLGGFMMFRVVTGSMEPTIPTGALLIAKEVDIETIQVNDIVCFRTQLSEIWGKIVTHRVSAVMEGANGSILLETKGDANLVSDIFFVEESNLIGRVVWHSGDHNLLAGILSLFSNKIAFLGCIALPILLLSSMILKDSVAGIRKDMLLMLEEANKQEQAAKQKQQAADEWKNDPLCGMTQEEYNAMYERIRAELMEELTQIYVEGLKEQTESAESTEAK